MDARAELALLNLDPATAQQVAAVVAALVEQAQQTVQAWIAAELQAKDLKIQALTFELAYYKRLRFGRKNESLDAVQQDLFEEACAADVAAITAETEQLQDVAPCPTVARPKRPRAGAAAAGTPAAHRASTRTRILYLRDMRPGFSQDR